MRQSIRVTRAVIGLILLDSIFIYACYCQGGGPPMLTDDPGTPGSDRWEINLSINTTFANFVELEAPMVDINYGYKDRTQIKIEIPWIISKHKNQKISGAFENPLFGIKYRILDNNEDSFYLSIYPQISIPLFVNSERKYKFPMQFEKDFMNLTIGEEAGYMTDGKGNGEYLNGLLLGSNFLNHLEIMAEYYYLSNFKYSSSIKMFINIGLRYEVMKNFILICSFGTQLNGTTNSSRKYFFSFTGIQGFL